MASLSEWKYSLLVTELSQAFTYAVVEVCTLRGNQIIVPSGKDKIEIGDTVLVVTTHQGFNTIEDITK